MSDFDACSEGKKTSLCWQTVDWNEHYPVLQGASSAYSDGALLLGGNTQQAEPGAPAPYFRARKFPHYPKKIKHFRVGSAPTSKIGTKRTRPSVFERRLLATSLKSHSHNQIATLIQRRVSVK